LIDSPDDTTDGRMPKTAVLLHNLGAPSGEEEMRPFLERLFSDPEIITLPLSRFFQVPLARWIAKRRAPGAWKKYASIGGSPTLEWTKLQAAGIAIGLTEYMPRDDVIVLPAMRYSPPFVGDALEQAHTWGAERLLSFSLYPQYSTTTTGSSEREMERCLEAMAWRPDIVRVSEWSADSAYLDCMAWRLRRGIARLPTEHRQSAHIVFSAHGTPQSFADAGDPYVAQIDATVDGIKARLDSDLDASLAFQCRVGPATWTRPYLDRHVRELAAQGVRALLVLAVSFVADHVETLHELDVETKELAVAAGIEYFERADSLNADPDFLGALTGIAARALGVGG
jgi:ferrochelatase